MCRVVLTRHSSHPPHDLKLGGVGVRHTLLALSLVPYRCDPCTHPAGSPPTSLPQSPPTHQVHAAGPCLPRRAQSHHPSRTKSPMAGAPPGSYPTAEAHAASPAGVSSHVTRDDVMAGTGGQPVRVVEVRASGCSSQSMGLWWTLCGCLCLQFRRIRVGVVRRICRDLA